MVSLRVRDRVKDTVGVGMVFKVRVRFPLSIQWRGGDGNIFQQATGAGPEVTGPL